MMYRRPLVLAVLGALGGGCGSSDLDLLCAAGDGVWTLQLVVSEKCSGTSVRSVFTSSYHEDNCRGTFIPLFEAGTIAIGSDEVLESCREALKVTPCEPELSKDWLVATAVCDDLVVGQTVTGGPCSVDDECSGTSYCQRSGSCGVCTAQVGNGAPCAGDTECQSGICATGICVTGEVPENGLCSTDRQCTEGLICRDGGHCQPLEGHIGLSCQTDNDCSAYQASCANGVCTALAKIMDPCTLWTGGDGTLPHCEWFASAGCGPDGTCTGLPVVDVGAACGVDVGKCGEGLWCSGAQCFPITDEGGFCNVTAECGPYGLCVENVCTFSEFNATCAAP